MAIEKFNKNMAIIAALDDEPNDVGGMTSAELKNKFDEGGKAIQSYMNETLIPALENLGVETAVLLPENAAGFKYMRLNADKVLEVSTDSETWQATGSSGHLIIDKDGKELPQRSRMRFSNSIVTDENGVTVVHGVKGDKGDKGDTGAQGPQGIQGVKGDRGYVLVPTIDDDGIISWSIQEPSTTVPASRSIRGPQGIQGIQGVKGDQGETGATGPQGIQGVQGPQGVAGKDGADGKSFTILGMYATLQELLAAHPTGNAGDAYAVGTAASNTVYNWNTEKSIWEDLGPLRGPQGPQGEQGVPGPQGEQGVQGATGPQGIQGIQGEQGIQGPEGPQGPRGYPANINGKTPDDAGNITLNAGDISGSVRYDAAQTLTDAQKTQARGNIAAAPSGYGFGGEYISRCAATSSDETYESFCTRLDEIMAGMPSNSVRIMGVYPPQIYGLASNTCSLVYQNADGYCGVYNLGMPDTTCSQWRMIKNNSVWQPFEWVNPPMRLGVEYRTTERYQRKPVYVKVVDFGALPNATTKTVTDNTVGTIEAIVDFGGEMHNASSTFRLPYQNTVITIPNVSGSKGISELKIDIATTLDYSAFTGSVWVKYTKTTD